MTTKMKFKLLETAYKDVEKDPVKAEVWALHFFATSRTWVQKNMLKELRRVPVDGLTGEYMMHSWWAWNGYTYWWNQQTQQKYQLKAPVAYQPILLTFFVKGSLLDAAQTMETLRKRFPPKFTWKPDIRPSFITPAGDFHTKAQFAKTA